MHQTPGAWMGQDLIGPPEKKKVFEWGKVFHPFLNGCCKLNEGFYVRGVLVFFHLYEWHKNQQLGPPSSRRYVKQIVIFLWPAREKSGQKSEDGGFRYLVVQYQWKQNWDTVKTYLPITSMIQYHGQVHSS